MGERILVKFKDGVSGGKIRKKREKHGGNQKRKIDAIGWRLIELPPDADKDAVLRDYNADPDVESAMPERSVYALSITNDPYYTTSQNATWDIRYPTPGYGGDRTDYGGQWNLDRIGMPAAWDIERGYRGVIVAVIDTGVNYLHQDLSGRCLILPGSNKSTGDPNDPYDANGGDPALDPTRWSHGTCCAGIIGAARNNSLGAAGIADCTIMPVRVLNSNGGGSQYECADGIVFAADNGAHILSLSLGMTPDGAAPVFDAVAYAVSKGCLVVCSAGNAGGTVLAPAAANGTLVVTASDMLDRMVSTDNWHFTCSHGMNVDVMAPGWYTTTPIAPATKAAGNQYTFYFRATSCACPHVAGAAALIWAQDPTLTARQVGAKLRMSAANVEGTASGFSETQGFGLLDVAAALAIEKSAIPDAPTINYTITPTSGGIHMEWDAVPDAVGYAVITWEDEYGWARLTTTYLPPTQTSIDTTSADTEGFPAPYVEAFTVGGSTTESDIDPPPSLSLPVTATPDATGITLTYAGSAPFRIERRVV
jgi:subtilisin family serine protease